MDSDAASGLEALVGLGVMGQDRDLLLGHHVENGPGYGNLGIAFGRLAGSESFELWVALFIEENDEPTINEQPFEDDVHDLFQDRFEVADLDQGLADLGERLEDALPATDTGR